MGEARERRLSALTLDRSACAVLVAPTAEGALVVLSRAPATVVDFVGSVDFAYDILEHLLTDPFDAMTVVDADARLVYLSAVHESFFGLKRGEGNGQPVKRVIENTRLDSVLRDGKPEVGACSGCGASSGWCRGCRSGATAGSSARSAG